MTAIKKFRNHAILKEENYKGIKFTICLITSGWFTCYLDVTKTKIAFIDYNNIDLPVHGDLTYSDCRYPWETNEDFRLSVIGWDYAHYGDGKEYDLVKKIFNKELIPFNEYGHHYTESELVEDCMKAIDYIKENYEV